MALQKVAISKSTLGIEAPMVVTEIIDGTVYSGFFGVLDSNRMAVITEKMLILNETLSFQICIIDLSNVDILDSDAAKHLIILGNTLALSGVTPLFCGIRSRIAQSMALAGITLSHFEVYKNAKTALKRVLEPSNI